MLDVFSVNADIYFDIYIQDVSTTAVEKHQIQVDLAQATATVKFDSAERVRLIMERSNGSLRILKRKVTLQLGVGFVAIYFSR